MGSLRSMCGVSRKDRCRNSDLKERCVLKKDEVTKIEKGMLRWFRYLERMNGRRFMKQVYRANTCGDKVAKGHSRKSDEDYVGGILKKGQILSTRNRRACIQRLMNVSEVREICKDRAM
ncbi:hypothetical protein EVAR_63837_1 [Eumeta japonica]|uniref:Uncharacterized protein n=1 Tax=Eumeta variegata TaxID=151549 RepID=A0A4C1Z6W9_EUMVA|nr:hypothetical protein EVAR_63837_1 [Eumeta japonica]